MHTQRNQHICGLDFIGCYIPLDAVQASRGNQMLSRENQIPHYTAHVGTQAGGTTHLSVGTFSFYNAAWKDKKLPLRFLQNTSGCQQWLCPPSWKTCSLLSLLCFQPLLFFPRKASAYGAEADFVEALFPPYNRGPPGPGEIRVTMNC